MIRLGRSVRLLYGIAGIAVLVAICTLLALNTSFSFAAEQRNLQAVAAPRKLTTITVVIYIRQELYDLGLKVDGAATTGVLFNGCINVDVAGPNDFQVEVGSTGMKLNDLPIVPYTAKHDILVAGEPLAVVSKLSDDKSQHELHSLYVLTDMHGFTTEVKDAWKDVEVKGVWYRFAQDGSAPGQIPNIIVFDMGDATSKARLTTVKGETFEGVINNFMKDVTSVNLVPGNVGIENLCVIAIMDSTSVPQDVNQVAASKLSDSTCLTTRSTNQALVLQFEQGGVVLKKKFDIDTTTAAATTMTYGLYFDWKDSVASLHRVRKDVDEGNAPKSAIQLIYHSDDGYLKVAMEDQGGGSPFTLFLKGAERGAKADKERKITEVFVVQPVLNGDYAVGTSTQTYLGKQYSYDLVFDDKGYDQGAADELYEYTLADALQKYQQKRELHYYCENGRLPGNKWDDEQKCYTLVKECDTGGMVKHDNPSLRIDAPVSLNKGYKFSLAIFGDVGYEVRSVYERSDMGPLHVVMNKLSFPVNHKHIPEIQGTTFLIDGKSYLTDIPPFLKSFEVTLCGGTTNSNVQYEHGVDTVVNSSTEIKMKVLGFKPDGSLPAVVKLLSGANQLWVLENATVQVDGTNIELGVVPTTKIEEGLSIIYIPEDSKPDSKYSKSTSILAGYNAYVIELQGKPATAKVTLTDTKNAAVSVDVNEGKYVWSGTKLCEFKEVMVTVCPETTEFKYISKTNSADTFTMKSRGLVPVVVNYTIEVEKVEIKDFEVYIDKAFLQSKVSQRIQLLADDYELKDDPLLDILKNVAATKIVASMAADVTKVKDKADEYGKAVEVVTTTTVELEKKVLEKQTLKPTFLMGNDELHGKCTEILDSAEILNTYGEILVLNIGTVSFKVDSKDYSTTGGQFLIFDDAPELMSGMQVDSDKDLPYPVTFPKLDAELKKKNDALNDEITKIETRLKAEKALMQKLATELLGMKQEDSDVRINAEVKKQIDDLKSKANMGLNKIRQMKTQFDVLSVGTSEEHTLKEGKLITGHPALDEIQLLEAKMPAYKTEYKRLNTWFDSIANSNTLFVHVKNLDPLVNAFVEKIKEVREMSGELQRRAFQISRYTEQVSPKTTGAIPTVTTEKLPVKRRRRVRIPETTTGKRRLGADNAHRRLGPADSLKNLLTDPKLSVLLIEYVDRPGILRGAGLKSFGKDSSGAYSSKLVAVETQATPTGTTASITFAINLTHEVNMEVELEDLGNPLSAELIDIPLTPGMTTVYNADSGTMKLTALPSPAPALTNLKIMEVFMVTPDKNVGNAQGWNMPTQDITIENEVLPFLFELFKVNDANLLNLMKIEEKKAIIYNTIQLPTCAHGEILAFVDDKSMACITFNLVVAQLVKPKDKLNFEYKFHDKNEGDLINEPVHRVEMPSTFRGFQEGIVLYPDESTFEVHILNTWHMQQPKFQTEVRIEGSSQSFLTVSRFKSIVVSYDVVLKDKSDTSTKYAFTEPAGSELTPSYEELFFASPEYGISRGLSTSLWRSKLIFPAVSVNQVMLPFVGKMVRSYIVIIQKTGDKKADVKQMQDLLSVDITALTQTEADKEIGTYISTSAVESSFFRLMTPSQGTKVLVNHDEYTLLPGEAQFIDLRQSKPYHSRLSLISLTGPNPTGAGKDLTTPIKAGSPKDITMFYNTKDTITINSVVLAGTPVPGTEVNRWSYLGLKTGETISEAKVNVDAGTLFSVGKTDVLVPYESPSLLFALVSDLLVPIYNSIYFPSGPAYLVVGTLMPDLRNARSFLEYKYLGYTRTAAGKYYVSMEVDAELNGAVVCHLKYVGKSRKVKLNYDSHCHVLERHPLGLFQEIGSNMTRQDAEVSLLKHEIKTRSASVLNSLFPTRGDEALYILSSVWFQPRISSIVDSMNKRGDRDAAFDSFDNGLKAIRTKLDNLRTTRHATFPSFLGPIWEAYCSAGNQDLTGHWNELDDALNGDVASAKKLRTALKGNDNTDPDFTDIMDRFLDMPIPCQEVINVASRELGKHQIYSVPTLVENYIAEETMLARPICPMVKNDTFPVSNDYLKKISELSKMLKWLKEKEDCDVKSSRPVLKLMLDVRNLSGLAKKEIAASKTYLSFLKSVNQVPMQSIDIWEFLGRSRSEPVPDEFNKAVTGLGKGPLQPGNLPALIKIANKSSKEFTPSPDNKDAWKQVAAYKHWEPALNRGSTIQLLRKNSKELAGITPAVDQNLMDDMTKCIDVLTQFRNWNEQTDIPSDIYVQNLLKKINDILDAQPPSNESTKFGSFEMKVKVKPGHDTEYDNAINTLNEAISLQFVALPTKDGVNIVFISDKIKREEVQGTVEGVLSSHTDEIILGERKLEDVMEDHNAENAWSLYNQWKAQHTEEDNLRKFEESKKPSGGASCSSPITVLTLFVTFLASVTMLF